MAAGLEATELGARLLAVAVSAGVDLGPAFGGDEELIRPTEIAQPALVFTEVVLAAALPGDLDVVAVAGHSVGELAALAAAGALDPEAALRLAVERGRLMAAMREGTMAAVLGLDAEAVARLCAGSGGTVVVANLNAPGQVVVSGSVEAVAGLSARAREAGARRVIPLRVSGAFHSPLMADAAADFVRVLDGIDMRAPAVPVIANVDASPRDQRRGAARAARTPDGVGGALVQLGGAAGGARRRRVGRDRSGGGPHRAGPPDSSAGARPWREQPGGRRRAGGAAGCGRPRVSGPRGPLSSTLRFVPEMTPDPARRHLAAGGV